MGLGGGPQLKETAGGAGFAVVTVVRSSPLGGWTLERGQRSHPATLGRSGTLNNVYVNRAMISSPMFADQPLLSNEPYALMLGWTLGNRVWRDNDGDGILSTVTSRWPAFRSRSSTPPERSSRPPRPIDGRWFVEGLPVGTFRVRIPPSAFAAGAPLAAPQVRTENANVSATSDEAFDNNNTLPRVRPPPASSATPSPSTTPAPTE